jgi:MFS family permease
VTVLVLFVRDPGRPPQAARVRPPLSRAGLARFGSGYWLVVGIAILFTMARFSEAFLLLRAQSAGMSLAVVPAMLVVMNVVYALAAWPAGELSDRLGRFGVLGVGFAVLIVADLVLAFGAGIIAVALGIALWGLHMGLTQGLLAALVADTAPTTLRGTAFGVFNFITGLAMLAASVLAGALWDAFGPQATFVAGALMTVLALAALPFMRGRMHVS